MSESTPDPTPGATPGATPDAMPGAAPEPESGPEPSGARSPGAPASGPTSAQDAVATLKQAHRVDLGIIGAGVLALIGSLMPYYTYSFGGIGAEFSAWHGFFGWFGALCALAGAAVLAAHLLRVALPVPVRTAVLALFGLALLCTLVALVVQPGAGCDSDGAFMDTVCDVYDEGHSVGYWVALLSTIAGTALAAMRRSAA